MTEDEGLKALLGGDAEAAGRAEAALWEMWHRSGDREIDALLREGVAVMERRDLAGAEAIFARVIEQAPAFAEGWNKRATVRYVAENYEGSIADCEETLTRNPYHFGAPQSRGGDGRGGPRQRTLAAGDHNQDEQNLQPHDSGRRNAGRQLVGCGGRRASTGIRQRCRRRARAGVCRGTAA